MATRSDSQKIGAKGHALVKWVVEESGVWVARDQDQDYGIDLELELSQPEVMGCLVKVQIKTKGKVEAKGADVALLIHNKYLRYADACRYPCLFVLADLATKRVWWLWIQEWLLAREQAGDRSWQSKQTVTIRVPSDRTLDKGLLGPIQAIARWEGEPQLVLSLRDCLQATTGLDRESVSSALLDLLDAVGHAGVSIAMVFSRAAELGEKLRGTIRGNHIASLLFKLCRTHGSRLDRGTIRLMVERGEGYSRVGLIALGILYDEFHDAIRELELPKTWAESGHLELEYYARLREKYAGEQSPGVLEHAGEFELKGFHAVLGDDFLDKWANRGDSAVLDYLVPVKAKE